MSMNIHLSGKLINLETKQGKAGEYVRAKIAAHQEGGTIWATVFAFTPGTMQALNSTPPDGHVAVIGQARIGTYEGKDGKTKPALDVIADRVCSVYEALLTARNMKEVKE